MTAKRAWASSLARRYARHRLRRDIDGVFVDGLDAVRAVVAERPVIFACNHVSWWDAFMLVTVDAAIDGGGHAVMDEANLRRLPFFAAIGAMPIDRRGGPQLRRQLAAAAATLSGPRTSLWVFPQGRQRAAHLRPLGLEPGLRLIARRSGAAVVPVSLAYPWREAPQPSLAVAFHDVVDGGRADLLDVVEAAIVAGLERMDLAVDVTGAPGGIELIGAPTRKGPQDGLGARLLARLLAPSTGDR